ncbi:MAG: LysM peptidoglycan-binding domain-containing protein [Sandaracinaceae bacterium]|nr:LysM peptidoglycan-binding domain-containing protein [Sandaracinaceae bacterium]
MSSALRAFLAAAAVWCAASAGSAQQRTYVVRPGDSLLRIARRHGVTVEALQEANRLRSTRVREGAQLTIPGPPGRGRWADGRGRRHRVREGDTLTRIARRYRVSVDDIRAANRMQGHSLRPGAELLIPAPGQSGAALRAITTQGNPVTVADPTPETEIAAPAAEQAQALGVGGERVAQRLLRETPDPAWVTAAGALDGIEGTLLMPVDGGRYLRGWGSGAGGYHLAVDIGAPERTTVRASERGLVAYAGHEVRGYGNIVMIVHPTGWVTAYAHNRVNLVVPGQLVERGQAIAEVGQTGFARGPHVHFILVYEGRHCDPTPLFSPRIVRANGTEPEGPEAVWDGERRPAAVQCLARDDRRHPGYAREHRRRGRAR